VSTFDEQAGAVAWRDRLRELHVAARCVADRPLDRFGRGDIYLVVPPEEWSRRPLDRFGRGDIYLVVPAERCSRANEIVENLDD
jgi:hypothetical protein